MNKKLIYAFISSIILIVSLQGCWKMNDINFKSKRITRSATITLNGIIDDVFPLFGAREEQKWEPNWKPEFIYPTNKPDEKNNIFKVEHKGHGILEKIVTYWIMTEFSKELNKISYAIFSEHYITTIDIQCDATNDSTTKALIEYNWTSLDEKGSKLIENKAKSIFSNNLADWEEAINQFLQKSP